MATISKFYFLDAATPNSGTMPTGAFVNPHFGAGTDATGSQTARDSTDTPGAAQTSAVATAAANTSTQTLQLRRYVSRPLAARTFANADGNWTWDYAALESNTNHKAGFQINVYGWRPSTGAQVGTGGLVIGTAAPTTTAEAHYNAAAGWGGTSLTIQDGDVLVFEITDNFTQSMGTAYPSTYFYNGTTDASTTNAASYITPPSALTLFSGAPTSLVAAPRRNMAGLITRMSRLTRRRSGIWVPADWKEKILVPQGGPDVAV